MSLCIKHGSSVEERDSSGLTPIHYACSTGQISVISFLTYHGATLDVRDNKGRTPLMVAAQYNQIIVACRRCRQRRW